MGGGVVEQFCKGGWKPLAFFSRNFSSTQRNYSTYDRELTAIFESIKYFRHFLEGREFKVVTDHKPLIYAFSQKLNKSSPRQMRQLSFISQFTTTLEFLAGNENVVADSLSRVNSVYLAFDNNLSRLVEAQKSDDELHNILRDATTSLNLKSIRLSPDQIIQLIPDLKLRIDSFVEIMSGLECIKI